MLAIGNGESRSNFNLNAISREKVACNAAYRDLDIDYLVCVDLRTLEEAKFSHSKIYTRQDWIGRYNNCKNIFPVPNLPYKGLQRWDDPFHWGSGPYAVLLAASLTKMDRVDMIGFDLYSETGHINNIYKGTKNYAEKTKRAVDPRYWIYQISKVFECFRDINFIIHQKQDWKLPDEWKKSNVMLDTISILHYNKTVV